MLQDKRYKNRELQVMRMLDHPNVIQLKHCFFSTTEKDELYLNLVLEYVSETVYRVSKHYIRMHQHMPIIYIQLYTYQVSLENGILHSFFWWVWVSMIMHVRISDSCWVCYFGSYTDWYFFLVDMPCIKLFASCAWCLSSWYQTAEFIGKILCTHFNGSAWCMILVFLFFTFQ